MATFSCSQIFCNAQSHMYLSKPRCATPSHAWATSVAAGAAFQIRAGGRRCHDIAPRQVRSKKSTNRDQKHAPFVKGEKWMKKGSKMTILGLKKYLQIAGLTRIDGVICLGTTFGMEPQASCVCAVFGIKSRTQAVCTIRCAQFAPKNQKKSRK